MRVTKDYRTCSYEVTISEKELKRHLSRVKIFSVLCTQ